MVLKASRSSYLLPFQVSRVWAAAGQAWCEGVPLNRFITVHFDKMRAGDAQAALGAFLKRAGDWLHKRSGNPAYYVWFMENPLAEFGKGGRHAHVLIHVPQHLLPAFHALETGWLPISREDLPKGAIHSVAMYFSSPSASAARYLEEGLLGLLRYLSKGIVAEAAQTWGIVGAKPQGEIRGKRSGYSESLAAGRRSLPMLVRGYPGVRVGGLASKRRRYLLHHFPELVGVPQEKDSESQSGSVFQPGLSD